MCARKTTSTYIYVYGAGKFPSFALFTCLLKHFSSFYENDDENDDYHVVITKSLGLIKFSAIFSVLFHH